MTVRIDVDDVGLKALERAVRTLAEQPYLLGAVGYKVRDRVIESEQRYLATARFAPRAPSTVRRYIYPLKSMADGQQHTSFGRGPLSRIGRLHHVLTTRQAEGQRDSIIQAPDGINVAFGVKARGPASYVGMQSQRRGERAARNPFRFDERGHRDAAGDVAAFVVEKFGGES